MSKMYNKNLLNYTRIEHEIRPHMQAWFLINQSLVKNLAYTDNKIKNKKSKKERS